MRSSVLGFLILLLVAAPMTAQVRHEGFWIGFGIGAGSDLSERARDARAGGAVYLRLGGTVDPRLLVGGELSGWGRSQNNTTLSRANVMGTLYLYPVRKGFFLKGGLGFAGQSVEAPVGAGTLTVSDEGLGAVLGGGYDIQLGSNLFLAPNLDFLFQVINDQTDVIALLTVGLTWH